MDAGKSVHKKCIPKENQPFHLWTTKGSNLSHAGVFASERVIHKFSVHYSRAWKPLRRVELHDLGDVGRVNTITSRTGGLDIDAGGATGTTPLLRQTM